MRSSASSVSARRPANGVLPTCLGIPTRTPHMLSLQYRRFPSALPVRHLPSNAHSHQVRTAVRYPNSLPYKRRRLESSWIPSRGRRRRRAYNENRKSSDAYSRRRCRRSKLARSWRRANVSAIPTRPQSSSGEAVSTSWPLGKSLPRADRYGRPRVTVCPPRTLQEEASRAQARHTFTRAETGDVMSDYQRRVAETLMTIIPCRRRTCQVACL